MYCTRPVARSPSVYRAIRSPCLGAATRNASFFPQQLFSRSSGNELAPFFRLFDDFLSPRSFDLAPAFTQQTRHTQVFQPRFDVREVGDNYELRGELPGVESQNLEVEFSDPQTLIIRGRTEQEYTSNSTPTTSQPGKKVTAESEIVAAPDTQEVDDKDSDAASTYSTGSYQRPSVEDDEGAAESSSAVPAANQPTATPTESTAATTETPAAAVSEQPQQQQPRYWVSERSTGSFQRVFSFGNRINQDAVTASLKNGILSIVVPKAAAPTTKKINIE